MNKQKCPKCKKLYNKLHKVNNKGLMYYLCYKCYKKFSTNNRKELLHYHDKDLYNNMLKYYNELDLIELYKCEFCDKTANMSIDTEAGIFRLCKDCFNNNT